MVLHRLSTTVPKADVIVTNPTDWPSPCNTTTRKWPRRSSSPKGPTCWPSGSAELALENSVPIVERKELARALYANVEIGQPVPAEQYAAVAEVMRYVYQLKGKKLPGAPCSLVRVAMIATTAPARSPPASAPRRSAASAERSRPVAARCCETSGR